MKKWRWILLPLILCFFTGCSKVSSADANLISVDKDGAITSAIIEPFDKDYYDKEELKQNIEDAIEAYNSQAGDKTIEMKSFKIRKDTAYVIMKYTSYKDYTEFNQIPIFVGTVQEAIAAGYDTEENLSKTGDNLLTTMQELAASQDTYHVVVVKEPLQVETPGDILYTSEFVSATEKKLAEVQAGSHAISAVVESDEDKTAETGSDETGQSSQAAEDAGEETAVMLDEYAYIVYK